MTRPHPESTAYVALGANLGDRLASLRAAAGALDRAPGVQLVARSAIYETAAVAPTPQPAYLNAVLRLSTALSPPALLELCLATERQLGRVRPVGGDKAPRNIDLDLLLHGEAVLEQPGLQLPHPGLLARAFVLIPLADVAEAGLRHPVAGAALDQADAHPDVRRCAEDWG